MSFEPIADSVPAVLVSLLQDVRVALGEPRLRVFETRTEEDEKPIGLCKTFDPHVGRVPHRPFEETHSLVKEYQRTEHAEPMEEVRPPDVLRRCAAHLLGSVLPAGAPSDPHDTFRFLDDRLRAIRKDFTVQRVGDRRCLEEMFRTHAVRIEACGATPADCRLFHNTDAHHNRGRLDDIVGALVPYYRGAPAHSDLLAPIVGLHMGRGVSLRVAVLEVGGRCDVMAHAQVLLEAGMWLEYCAMAAGPTSLDTLLLGAVITQVRAHAIADFAYARAAGGRTPRLAGTVRLSYLRDRLLFVSTEDLIAFLDVMQIPTDGEVLVCAAIKPPGVTIRRGMRAALCMPIQRTWPRPDLVAFVHGM